MHRPARRSWSSSRRSPCSSSRCATSCSGWTS
uniref:Uncharacterized protein n=1 Tax=Siphoviridae sp. ctwfx1 TaxID=2825732 RepID=A0A8S5UVI5_9CAUD|nr:MAG TPA: hypothetical protein [Siphoviridae sp. ctwfx1]